jgi:hypothetical protein
VGLENVGATWAAVGSVCSGECVACREIGSNSPVSYLPDLWRYAINGNFILGMFDKKVRECEERAVLEVVNSDRTKFRHAYTDGQTRL